MIRDPRQHQPHIYAAVCSDAQGADHRLINGQVRRGDPHIAAGIGNELLIGILHGADRVVIRSIHQGLAKIAAMAHRLRAIGIPWVAQLAVHTQPQVHKLPGQAPGSLPIQADAAILPVAKANN